VELPAVAEGSVAADLTVGGTVGAPTFAATVALARSRYGDLEPLAVSLRIEDGGRDATMVGSLHYLGARALDVEVKLPLDLAALLRDPTAVARRLRDVPAHAVAAVPGLDLAGLAGRMGLPEDLRGTLTARAELAGTSRAPRGQVTLRLGDGGVAGYAGVSADVTLTAREAATVLEATAALQGAQVVKLATRLGLPVERLGEAASRAGVPVDARLDVPRSDLRRMGAPVPLAGEVAGHATIAGTLDAPRLEVEFSGKRLELGGRPLGDLTATARGVGRAVHAEVHLAVKSGGTLDGALDADADLGLPALRRGELGRAPARARLTAKDLDLGFLPAVAPGTIRSASGKLAGEVSAAGPLARMTPRGTMGLAGGRMAVTELGEWQDITLSASLTEDAFRLDRLDARRGSGKFALQARADGLARRGTAADVEATLHTEGFTVARAGQDLATVDVDATVTGTASREELVVVVRIPRATVKLPDRIPRQIQPLDQREDIVVAPFGKKEPVARGRRGGKPYHVNVHVLAPQRFLVKSDKPVIDLQLKADVIADHDEGELTLTGDVETLRGRVEPIGNRNFDVKRGRVHFTGEGYKAGVLEIQAVYDNPAAKVTVAIGGTIASPDVKLTSSPPMDESQIALLIATGRTELKAGTGGVGLPQEAGNAALGALSQQAFKDLIADKLPVDTVSLDSSQLRAGKYVGDKIYVGYTRRFNARVELGENTNEVRLEYQITPRWNFEVRYGDSATGGASLIWSKDY
jgi:translocation and assembly module TamB